MTTTVAHGAYDTIGAKPLILTPVPAEDVERGDGRLVAEFIEGSPDSDGFCRITKESVGGRYGDLIRLRPWQHDLTGMVHARTANGRYRHREALIGLPRKQGKSALGSSYALNGLVMGPRGGEVYSCAAEKDQARIVFNAAKKMVQLDPQLDYEQGGIIKVYRDALEYVETGSIYKVLSSESYSKEGLNPTVVVYDELHAAETDELYYVMTQAMGARYDPLFIIITTAGVKTDTTGQDSICYRRFQYGQKVASGEIDDPTFFMAWYGAPQSADHKDPEVWKAANPGYGDLIDPQDFVSVLGKVSENEFRTKRLNQWVSSVQAWLPAGTWNKCRNPDRDFVPGKRGIVLGFDGSRNGDSTALVGVTVDSNPVIKVFGLWERPVDAGPDWKVPRGSVKDAIRKTCRENRVREIAWDEWLWDDAAEELEEEGLPIVRFPQTMTMMGPATQRFYEMVTNQRLEHGGDARLARHLENAQLKTDTRGARLVKDHKASPRKIDLAVAAVMAVHRAAYYLTQPVEDEPMYVWKDESGVEHSKPVSQVGFVW